jgi:hypothetical protein
MTMSDDDTFRDDFNLGEAKPAPEPKAVPETWRLIPDVEVEHYFADEIGAPQPSFSNSLATPLLNETPLDAAFKHPKLNPDYARDEAKATAAMRRGDVVHQLALGKGRGFAVAPEEIKDWRSNAAKAFKERAEEDGLTPVIASKFEEAEIMANVIKEKVKRVLDGADYQTEVAFLYQEETAAGPIWVRGMMDIWCPDRGIILDPKITGQLYDATVGRQMVNMGWDRQLALYERAVGMILPKYAGRVRAYDLMIKPEAPFTSRLVAPEKGWRYSSVKQAQQAMEIFGECLYSGRWPGFGDDVHHIACPTWEAVRREKAELGEV